MRVELRVAIISYITLLISVVIQRQFKLHQLKPVTTGEWIDYGKHRLRSPILKPLYNHLL